jgi:predicted MFS family arabinose efflux permease
MSTLVAERATRRELVLVGTLALTSFTMALNGQFFAPVLPQVARDLGVSPAVVGQLIAVSSLTGAALALVAGPISDRTGRRPMVLGGLTLLVATSLLAAAAPSYAAMLVVRVLAGVGMAALGATTFAAVADFIPEQRQPQSMGWVVGFSAGSIVIGWPAISWIAANASWRAGFLALAGLTALLIVLSWLVIPAGRVADAAGSLLEQVRRYRLIVTDPAVVLGVLASGLGAASWFGLSSYLGAYFQTALGLGLADQAPLLSAVGIAYFIASVSGGLLAARLGVRRVAVATGFGTALLLVGLIGVGAAVAPAVAIVMGLAALRAGGLTSLSTLILNLRPAERGSVGGLNNVGFSLGVTAGAGLGGAALAAGGFPLLFLALAALAVVSSGLLVRDRRKGREERDPHPDPLPEGEGAIGRGGGP